MSLPPPPGSYGHQPPTGGQPGGGAPQPWSQQPYLGGPSGPPPSGPPPWGPQQQWAGGPPPPSGGGKAKWILGGLAAILAIALVVVITVLVVRPDGGGSGSSNAGGTGSDSEFASANDTGPVSIITEDPTCDAWNAVVGKYSTETNAVKWDDRDPNIPASSWTPEQRSMYENVGKAMGEAADRAANLSTKTPHRVMRILYEQFIAYTRAFVERIPSYVPEDVNLAGASNGAGDGLAKICSAISFRVSQAVSPLVPTVEGPTKVPAPQDPNAPTELISGRNAICRDWESQVSKFADDTANWRAIDKNIPAKDWTPEQRAVNDAAGSIMMANSDEMERLGRQSRNAALEDLAVLAAQYRRAFVTTLPDYKSADGYLALSATNLVRIINLACKAAA